MIILSARYWWVQQPVDVEITGNPSPFTSRPRPRMGYFTLTWRMWLRPSGYQIRLAIAGHDAGAFERISAEGEATITVYREPGLASYVDLPVMEGGAEERRSRGEKEKKEKKGALCI